MRILALDVGTHRIGVAISDPLGITASPHSTIQRNKQAVNKIAQLAKELEVGCIVVGLPLHLGGHEGRQAMDVRSFAARLIPVVAAIPVEFWDERLTTVEAEERIGHRRSRGRRKKKELDAAAAAIILESYLLEKSP